MKRHQEQLDNEVWVGNTHHVDGKIPHLHSLKTVRVGNTAYDIHGKELPSSYCKPLFIGKSEFRAYDIIMMQRMKANR